MKRKIRTLPAVLCALGAAASMEVGAKPCSHEARRAVGPRVSFEANLGQTDAAAKFVARGRNATAWICGADAVFAFSADGGARDVLGMTFVGATTSAVAGRDALATKSDYFRGGAADLRDVPHFGEVVAKDVWPGTDVRWHAESGRLEYDAVFAAHADPSAFRVAFRGADALRVAAHGELVVSIGGREIVQSAPVAWQTRGAEREPVAAAFDVRGGEVGLRLGAYDASRALVVDPSIDFSTYLGGSGDETGNGVAVDGGATYVVGGTTSIDFPQGFGHIPSAPKGLMDAYVAKIDASGAFVRWATYLGGKDYDEAFGVAVDPASHDVWITGQTFSTNFPTMNPTQPAKAGEWDAFVARIDQNGDFLKFSTYLGGTSDDFGRGIAVGGVASVTGFTKSVNFPTLNAVQPANAGGYDAFLASFSLANPPALTQSTYVGGAGDDRGYAVASFAGQLVAGAPGTVELVTNGSFEAGGGSFSGWTTSDVTPAGATPPFEPLAVRPAGYQSAVPSAPWSFPAGASYPFIGVQPAEGNFAAVTGFGMGANAGTISIEQDLAVPPTTDDGLLTFHYRAGWLFFGSMDRRFDVDVVPSVGPSVPLWSHVYAHNSIGAAAPTVDFESEAVGFAPSFGYGGIAWGASDWSVYLADPSFPANSGVNVVQALNATNSFTRFFTPFVFDGAYVSGPLGDLVRWDLYYGGVLVYQSGTHAAGGTSTLFPTGYTGPVDEVRLVNTTYSGVPVALDDLGYRALTNTGPLDDGDTGPVLPVDLTDYAGSTIKLRFRLTIPEADTGPAHFELDDVHFLAAKGHVAVAGRTTSPDFPHKNTYNAIGHTFQDAPGGGADAFVADYTRSGRKVRWQTTFGGAGDDEARGVSVVSDGDVAIVGSTNSANFPLVQPWQRLRRGPDDAFVAKVLNGAATIDFSTYLGGGGSDSGNGVVLSETTGDVYVVGTTGSTDFPTTPDAFQTPLGGGMNTDAFVARFGTVVNAFSIAQSGLLKHASAFGGSGYEYGNAIAVPNGSTVHVVGTTRSPVGFPLVGALDGTMAGPSDAFVVKATISSALYPAGGFTVEARAPDSLALSWKPLAEDAAALRIERTAQGGAATDVATLAPTASQFTDTGLAADTSYSYAVVAVRDDGSTTPSNAVAATTLPYPPAAPTGLVATVVGSRVSLAWTDASSNETGFEIQRSVGSAFETVARVKADSTRFDKTLIASAAADATWRVVAVNRGGSSAPSNEVRTTTRPTLQLSVLAGTLVDAAAAGADRFSVSGRVAGAESFDPNADGVRIEFGAADAPIVLAVPAASRGWTSKKGVLSFSSAKGFLGGARFTLVLDPRRGTFSLNVSAFDFPTAPTSSVSLGFALGADAGAASAAWTAKAAGRFVAK